ncbi:MAG: hypothetical protein LBH39_01580, partial [Clostridiales Family XIII bacterium]|nr:hypothetical protein [Clostridiales Family XIII bacterium]
MSVLRFDSRDRRTSKVVAFILALTLILPTGFGTAFGADIPTGQTDAKQAASTQAELPESADFVASALPGVEIAVSKPIIEMTKKDTHTVTLTVPAIAFDTVPADADAWAKSLTWELKRDSEDSPQWADDATKALFKNIYTGDLLENWKTWGYNGTDGAPMFTGISVAGSDIGDAVRVELSFDNELFFANNRGVGIFDASTTAHRNVPAAFVGEYKLTAKDGDEEVACVSMDFRTYETYRTYAELRAELDEIKAAALANGRYMEIESYGESEGGFDQYYITFASSKETVDNYLELTERAETEPAAVQAELSGGTIEYALPFHINNIHPDENPGSDAPINFLWKLATQDEIEYSAIDGYAATGLGDPSGYTTDAIKEWSNNYGRIGVTQGAVDVNEQYTFADGTFVVNEILEDIFFIITPNENPDGRTVNSRRNMNGFDLNRDGSFQTQKETYNMMQLISKWNPIALVEFHGFVNEFLIEPCTPPHEPNLEYDILVEYFYKGAEAFGNAALGSLKGIYPKADGQPSFSQYHIPLRDGFGNEKVGEWDAWDDLSTNYTPSYAMLNSNTFGYTIETPDSNQACTDLLEYGLYGLVSFIADEKDTVFNNQLEFFKRGIENTDVSTVADNALEKYYVDLQDKVLNDDLWRPKFDGAGETGKFFPEYYVIPVDRDAQRDPAAAADMEDFLFRNDVRLKTLKSDTLIDGVMYKAGTLIVDMHQAKRGYANAVLWDGINSSFFAGLYSESVVSHPKLRGFDCIAVAKAGAIPEGSLADLAAPREAISSLGGDTLSLEAVAIRNNGTEAVRAVNRMLADGKDVGFVSTGTLRGSFLVEKEVFAEYSSDFALIGTGVVKAGGDVYKLEEPKLYIVGRFQEYNTAIASGYYETWFGDGYGAKNWSNIHRNENSNFDLMAFGRQLGFRIAETPADASVIVGATALGSGQHGADAVAAVKAGKPYIATGAAPLGFIGSDILPGTGFDSTVMRNAESLHRVDYPSDSVITAPQAQAGDDIIYSHGGAYFTSVPSTAAVLIRAKTAAEDFHIAGCFPNVGDDNLGGKAEAFSYVGPNGNGEAVDVTVFANSIVRKAHQQDDYLFATNAIYSKSLGELWDEFSGIHVEISVSKPIIEMTQEDTHVVTLTIPAIAFETVPADADAWAKSLTWELKRDKEDSPQWSDEATKALFANIYTGDLLGNWKTWGSDGITGSVALFDNINVAGSAVGDAVRVELSFDNGLFLGGTDASVRAVRNVPSAFVGEYELTAKYGGEVVAATVMDFKTYKSYRTYNQVRSELELIKAAAAAKGRYMEIKSFGESEGGFDMYYVTLAKSKAAVDGYLALTRRAEAEPAKVLQELNDGLLGDYAVPYHINNIHPDECPGSDAPVNMLWTLATADEITYSAINGFKPGVKIDSSLRTTDVISEWNNNFGRVDSEQGASDIRDQYTFDDRTIRVDDLLDDVIFIVSPNENPDGRTLNTRRNINGFDLNRDGSFQTQKETTSMMRLINEWNPLVLTEFHGFVKGFLVEPCTPPHEPNVEYDLLAENLYKGGEAFGNAALGSLKDMFPNTFSKYEIPLRDYLNDTWRAWDDFSVNYTPNYAMANCHTLGYTIETPYSNEASTKLFEYGAFGLADYLSQNKDSIFSGQLEFFRRGVENIDVTVEPGSELQKYYRGATDNQLSEGVWRPKYDGEGETGKYFPEYYVIPKDSASQRDIADVAEIERFLDRNGVKLKALKEDLVIDGTAYKAGTLVVDMHQAKRGYANAVLADGVDSSFYAGLYSESIVSHPRLRG